MPLTLTVSEGVLPAGEEKLAFSRLSDAMLRWHGAAGNTFMTPNVVGSVQVIPQSHTFSGSTEAAVAFVEWKVPAFAFATRQVQEGYIAEATEIIHAMSGRRLPKDHIWVNVVHAVDGAWGIAGQAMTNAQIGQAASRG